MTADDITPDQAQQLRNLGGASRTTRTIDAIAETGVLWVWGDEDETLFMEDADGVEVLPIWPHALLATAECGGKAAREAPIEVTLDRFTEVWLPQIEEDDGGIAVFPVDGRIAVTLSPDEFTSKIEAARRAAERHV